ncbi:TIGR04500 family putative peptide maturation system protein, partial [Streptosporangium sp. NPDC048865]|uniref:TIGR04500 family putative peptide maturation system protein n=1 Tax=Streptosporangium sp. NPDC048865 TaxID=3155766 RepID=UPI00342DE443
PQALTMLRSLSRRDASPYREIVDQCLLAEAVEAAEGTENAEGTEGAGGAAPLTAADLQETADEFRRGRGLHDRASTLAWMAEAGMSGERFEAYIAEIARRRRFRRDREAELAPGHLAANRGDFALVRAVWVTGDEVVTADTAAGLLTAVASLGDTTPLPPGESSEASFTESPGISRGETTGTSLGETTGTSLGETTVTFATRREAELPPALRGAPPGRVVGPVESPEGGFLTGAVLSRSPARDDAETLAAAGRAAFTGWLAERRAAATVEWHWS